MNGLVQRWVSTRVGFKPRDVEEPIDYYWHRPLAGLLVQVIEDWPVTPNQVTLLSGLVSLLSGIVIGVGAYHQSWWCSVGGALLLLSIVLDCADGQLARIRGVSSAAGRILDGLIDAVAPLSVFHGMAFFLLENGYGAIWIWPIGLATGASLIWHASVYDVNKNIYLHASRPDFNLGGATLMTQDDMRKMRAEFEQSGEKAFARLMTVWVAWTAPQMKALEPWTAEARTPANEAEREQFRALFRPAMRSLAWVGFGTHLFVLTMAALFAPLDPRAIWVAWALILVPMNVVCAWTELTRAGRVRRLEQSLAEMRADKEG